MNKLPVVILAVCLIFTIACGDEASSKAEAEKREIAEATLEKQSYDIFIIMDTTDVWSMGIRDGFRETMDALLKEKGAVAQYTVFDTEVNPEKIPAIISEIDAKSPDLLCMINYPDGFADQQITNRYAASNLKFVSENCIPVESGTIQSWEKPGGNVTGVGVFIQMNSPIRLMKKINPQTKKLAFFSWSAMEKINEWFEKEITRACREEGIELVEFRLVPDAESEFQFFDDYSNPGPEYFIMGGISAFLYRDGTQADMNNLEPQYTRNHVRVPLMSYDEVTVNRGMLAGTCVIWYDIGAQLAEKGLLVLGGKSPGVIPWDYPRKYNILLNLQNAKDLGMAIPQDIINAAYRVYIDYEGNYKGQTH